MIQTDSRVVKEQCDRYDEVEWVLHVYTSGGLRSQVFYIEVDDDIYRVYSSGTPLYGLAAFMTINPEATIRRFGTTNDLSYLM